MSALKLFNYRADYSSVEGSNLPFEFELDAEKSVLEPPEGMNQRFVYNVIAKGKDSIGFKDLSYFILSLGSSITLEDIINPTMTLNGNVLEFGELSLEEDGKGKGGFGLKVLLKAGALSKLTSNVITFSFELAKRVAVGPIELLVKGGSQMLNGLNIGGPIFDDITGRDTVVYKKIEVCTPVEVTPIVKHGCITAHSCGVPVVSSVPCTRGSQKCKFYVRQSMRIRIPLSYTATATVESSTTNCGFAGDTFSDVVEDKDFVEDQDFVEHKDFIEDTECTSCKEETNDL